MRKNCKCIVIGDSTVGKTSLIYAFQKKDMSKLYNTPCSTIGISYCSIVNEDNSVLLHIWDTAGQERFRSIVPSYFRGARVIIAVYDRSNPVSYDNLKDVWLPLVEDHISDYVESILVLVENKIDIEDNLCPDVLQLETSVTSKFGKVIKAKTSAVCGDGVQELVQTIFEQVNKLSELKITVLESEDNGIISSITTPITKTMSAVAEPVIKLTDKAWTKTKEIGSCTKC